MSLNNKAIDEQYVPIILLAEDNTADQNFFSRAVLRHGEGAMLKTVNNGVEAISYLENSGKFTNQEENPTPNVIVLDINMPRLDGKKVLGWIRENKDLNTTPVVMMSTSDNENDVSESYKLGANDYLTKPSTVSGMNSIVCNLQKKWLNPSGCSLKGENK